jgi:hypothetical protein
MDASRSIYKARHRINEPTLVSVITSHQPDRSHLHTQLRNRPGRASKDAIRQPVKPITERSTNIIRNIATHTARRIQLTPLTLYTRQPLTKLHQHAAFSCKSQHYAAICYACRIEGARSDAL